MTSLSPLSLIFVTFIISFSTLVHTSSSLSSVAISHTPSYTLICALIPNSGQSNINCSTLSSIAQNPISSNVSFSAIIGGNGFLCGLRPVSSSNDSLSCWRFSDNGTILTYRSSGAVMTRDKRIYLGEPLAEIRSGTSNFCALVGGTRRLKCWQRPEFSLPVNQSFLSIAVGGEFVCGLSDNGVIECFGNNSSVVGDASPRAGNFSVVAAGWRHACAIRANGSVDCWGEMVVTAPSEEFESLALGEDRSCGIRTNGTVVCWGVGNFQLPQVLKEIEFIEIEAKMSIFCGIGRNYSLICWGNGNLDSNHMVFAQVLPGPCRRGDCPPCSRPILNSSNLCAVGNICEPCKRPPSPSIPPFPPTENPSPSGGSKGRVAFLVVGSVGCFVGLVTVCFLLFRFCRKQLQQSSRVHDSGRLDEEATPPQPLGPSARRLAQVESIRPHLDKRLSALLSLGTNGNLEEFSLHVLLRVSENFSDDHRIGTGSFGSVYRATLDDGREVAIKRAELTGSSSYASGIGTRRQENECAFLSELALLSRLNHKNLVRLIGYSDDGNERLLVYEFMVNGTLHEHLHKLESSPLMSWVARLNVALDAARGIEYLHTYAVPQIIHRDIKSSNILLDDTWSAKVSDFGLSIMGPDPDEDMSHISLRAAGTVGYMDPEYFRLQQLTTKSDVYSFGVLLLELLTGYKAIHRIDGSTVPRNVVDFAVPHIVTDEIHHILDKRLPPPTPREIEPVAYVGYLATDCVSPQGRDRPSMNEIVNRLERALTACSVQSSLSRSTTGSST